MIITATINEEDLCEIIADHISNQTGRVVTRDEVKIETRSKQNYKSTWERADFRATYQSTT